MMARALPILSSTAAFAAGMALVAAWMIWQDPGEAEADHHANLRKELQDLRTEIENQRKIQRFAARHRGDRDSNPDGPRAAPGPRDSVPQDDPRYPDEGEGEHPFPDDAEVAAREEERMEVLTAALESQPRNAAWASSMEEDIDDTLAGYVARFPGGVAQAATCAESLCRMEVTFPDRSTFRRYNRSFYPPQGLSQGYVRFIESDDGPKMIAFYAKEGTDLPRS